MQHTPGPWTAYGTSIHGTIDGHAISIATTDDGTTEDDYVHEWEFTVGKKLDSQKEANARLIAAAPYLYEACKAALPKIAATNGPLFDLLTNAIAKAEPSSTAA